MENLTFSNLQPLPFLLQSTHQSLPRAGSSFGAELWGSGEAGSAGWVAHPCQEGAGKVSGGPAALGDGGLACSCHGVAAGTAGGDLVLVSQSPWKRQTFPLCNSGCTAHLHAVHHIEGVRLKRWDERFDC